MNGKFVSTIIITIDLHNEIRGYSLYGREFVLKEEKPRKHEAITLDGFKILDDYWVITKEEYMRVVPEAAKLDIDSNNIYIPIWSARKSFRPCYIKNIKVKL